jgi:hypothetical protein
MMKISSNVKKTGVSRQGRLSHRLKRHTTLASRAKQTLTANQPQTTYAPQRIGEFSLLPLTVVPR